MMDSRFAVKVPWIVWAAIFLHVTWGVLLLIDDQAANCTPIAHSLSWVQSPGLLASIYFAASGLALLGATVDIGFMPALICILPQQFVLMFSSVGAMLAIYNSQFPDLVVRSRSFIAADQSIEIIVAIFHTISVVDGFYGDYVKHLVGRPPGCPKVHG